MIEKLREYFRETGIIDKKNRLNVDFLGENPTEFAIVPIPTERKVPDDQYIEGSSLKEYKFRLISCNDYGHDVIQNMYNSSFYEQLCKTIEINNNKRILPKIDGIQSIECLDNGALLGATTNTAKYAIQMKITYLNFLSM